ncbi:2-aminoethanethiol dioxygenase-like [Ptychodera flava]|uniref:2-aminoethanethiol dioxygenase-like n=1 Tax=Ptychodera flava TaxID=63121 RepID=UPI00396A8F20
MASLIQRVAGQARQTFRMSSLDPTFKENLKVLSTLMENVKTSDLNLKPRNTGQTEPYNKSSSVSAPVTYMHIWEDEHFTMGIFLLKHGCRIPLHDHPGMFGILKVLYGKIRLKCFDRIEEGTMDPPEDVRLLGSKHKLTPGRFSTEQLLDGDTGTGGVLQLGQSKNNYHDIVAVDGPAAFLDILAPPYDPSGGRDCTYYREMDIYQSQGQAADSAKDNVQWLAAIPQPRDFWCDYEVYPGPEVEL